MDTFKIYSMMPVPVQNWLVGLYSGKLEKERRGKEYNEILEFLQTTETWSAEQIRRYKEGHLSKIIEQAYHHCPYYRKKYDEAGVSPSDFTCLEDLRKFPILTKEEVRNNLEGLMADNVERKQLVHYHTSGTTGKALDFYYTKYNLRYYWAVCARYKKRFGIADHDLHLNFTGKIVVPLSQSKPPYWRFKKSQNQYMLNMQHITEGKIRDIMDFIEEKDFKFFVGYPSIMYALATLAQQKSIVVKDSPELIFSSAEKMWDYQQEAIHSVFPRARFVQHYGFSENAGCASMCKGYHYHEDFELGHLELKDPVVDGDLSTGILLATGFHNYAMPFIRYEVGDTLTFDNKPCECGLQSQVIREVNGRNEDYVITPEGTRIMRFDYLFKDSKDVLECQVAQRRLGEMVIRIVRREGYHQAETEKNLLDNVRTMISPTIDVTFEYVDSIPRTKAGKFKAVVSELGGGKLLTISSQSSLGRPTGGVAMHVHRLMKKVIEPYFTQYGVCDYKKERLWQQIRKIRNSNVIHVHVSNPYGRILYALLAKLFGKKSLLTIHGNIGRFKGVKNIADKLAVRWYDVPVLINKESYDQVAKLNSRAVYIPAFIPPIKEEEVLAGEVVRRIEEIKSDGHPLFVTNASRRSFTDKGEEIYGIDFLMDFFAKHPEYNLLFMDPKNHYEGLYENRGRANVHILTGAHSFCGVMELSDYVIRNTPTDGDSFSVKEGLCYHKKVLATDAVSRPAGVFLFKYSDEASLEEAISKALAYNGTIDLTGEDTIRQYIELYSRMGVC